MRVVDAGAAGVVLEAVVRALQLASIDDLATAQRGEAMHAAVLQCNPLSAISPENRDGFPKQRLVRDRVGLEILQPTGHIPGIANKPPRDHRLVKEGCRGYRLGEVLVHRENRDIGHTGPRDSGSSLIDRRLHVLEHFIGRLHVTEIGDEVA